MRKTPKLAKLQSFENLHFMFSVETSGIFIKYIFLKSQLHRAWSMPGYRD